MLHLHHIYIYIYIYSAKRMSIEHSFVIVYTNSLKFLKHERFNANFFFPLGWILPASLKTEMKSRYFKHYVTQAYFLWKFKHSLVKLAFSTQFNQSFFKITWSHLPSAPTLLHLLISGDATLSKYNKSSSLWRSSPNYSTYFLLVNINVYNR